MKGRESETGSRESNRGARLVPRASKLANNPLFLFPIPDSRFPRKRHRP